MIQIAAFLALLWLFTGWLRRKIGKFWYDVIVMLYFVASAATNSLQGRLGWSIFCAIMAFVCFSTVKDAVSKRNQNING